MKKIISTGWVVFAFHLLVVNAASATTSNFASQECSKSLTREIPRRSSRAPAGSDVMQQLINYNGTARDSAVIKQVLSGNVPSFLRDLTPVRFSGNLSNGQDVQVTICVTPDYLSVGNDRDFVRVPIGLPAAAEIADQLGFFLPTTKMVDAIYSQAQVHLAPSPMKPTNQMSSTSYLMQHNQTVESQRAVFDRALDELTAGQKKDLVLSNRLRAASGKVAIYGWHRTNGVPIQPLSTVHGEYYADYSHGVRLVSETAFVNGKAQPLAVIMQDPNLAKIVSSEGPINRAQGLLVSLYR